MLGLTPVSQSIISCVYTQSQLLQKEIYLIDRIDSTKREKMRHLKCITFLRPSPLSIQHLCDELRDPCFGEYYCYFSNTLQKSFIERLAEGDTEVQEYYADYISINTDLFSLNVTVPEYPLFVESNKTWDNASLQRVTEGITAVLLSLKKKPLIRFENNSVICKKLAAEITYSIGNEGPLYDFRKMDTPPILLILDRRNDPVTPLLNQWTYQLVGIINGRVDLSNVKDVREEVREIVLSAEDSFYTKNMFLNLGELGTNIKTYVDEFQQRHNSNKKIESVQDMKRFVDEYPEFRKLSGNVTKHVALVGELSRKVASDRLLEVGELEQSLAVSNSHSIDSKQIETLLKDSTLSHATKLKLVLLYALRYERSSNMSNVFCEALRTSGASEKMCGTVAALLMYAGSDVRMDLTSSVDIMATTKNVFKGLKGVENVYTQHSPRLVTIFSDLIKGKLSPSNYPFFEGSTKEKPQDVIIFMVGGATYGEALEVSKLNASGNGVRIVLGGTCIHNSESFLEEVRESVSRWSLNGKESKGSSQLPATKVAKISF